MPDRGQTTSLHPPSVWEFAHEVVSHYIAAEGKLRRTLALHSFWFFLAFATALLPDVIGQWLALGLAGYCLCAQQRVYGGRWWTTLLRGMAITVPYSLVIGVGAAGLALALLST